MAKKGAMENKFIQFPRMENSYIGGMINRVEKAFVGASNDIGWLQRDPHVPPVEDGTKRFDDLLYNIRYYKEHTLPNSLVYLLVPGLFSNHGPISFVDTRDYLLKMGLQCEIAQIKSEASVVDNAKRIKETIERLYNRSGKRVVILGHSKGGLDSAAALSIYWRDLKDKVAGLVLAQSPYAGNAIASDFLREGLFKNINLRREMLEMALNVIFDGDLRSIEDLSYEKRREFLREHPLPQELPVVSFHSEAKLDLSVLTSFYEVARVELSVLAPNAKGKVKIPMPSASMAVAMAVLAALVHIRYQEESDGLVTRKDAEAPGSVVVRWRRKVDHAWVVYPSLTVDGKEASNSQVIEALFKLVTEVGRKKGFPSMQGY